MRIAHVITKGDVGGAQTHLVELVSAQISAGDTPSVVAGSDGPAMDRLRQAGAQVRILAAMGDSRTQLRPRDVLGELRATLIDLQPDIVHAHSSHAGFLARVVCRRAGLVCVYTAHGWPFQRGAALGQRAVSFAGEFVAGRLGDGVICLTEAEAARARRARIVADDRLWVIPNGLTDVDAGLRRRSVDDVPGIVMVARFAPPKLQAELIEVMSAMLDRAWRLTFVGDGPEMDVCLARGEQLLGDRVTFLGHRDDVAEILADHDVIVLWSRYEGMPISLLEGMRAGLCCVGSDLPGVRALFGEPACGVVAGAAASLAVELSALLDAPGTIRSLGDLARSRFERCFSSSAMQVSTSRVYAELLARRTTR